ncbi:MAG: HAMP domain-containing sensor histidine kinase [Bacteroidota bacterium]
MNKKSIWFIIGLMSMALLGVVLMQSYWINYSFRLNEAQFNRNVKHALNDVTQKLLHREIETVSRSFFFPDFPEDPQALAFEEEIFFQLRKDPNVNVDYTFHGEIPEDSSLLIGKDIFYYQNNYDQPCISTEDYQHLYEQFDMVVAGLLNDGRPLIERIDVNWLDELLQKELHNKGINLDVSYGVFSNMRRKFVFVKTCEEPVTSQENSVTEAGLHRLFTSPFQIDLFQNLYQSPGKLMIHFPGKAGFIWASVWPMLLGSILFTGIILFCFIYTVQVIFKQKKLSEIKNDFLNNMTHEFKTPIATISLAADSINSPVISGDKEKVTRFATIIKEENKRMNSQVEKVLQMSLLDKKEFQLKLKDIDLHEVVETAARHLALQVERKGGSIQLFLQADNFVIEADPTHLSNVMHNLLDNANKYSPENPEIAVSTRNVSGGVEITVADKGIGMNNEARKRIFDKFYRVHTGNLHDVKGFGLGLSYVKAILTAHKGHIDVKSELGKGSEFILFFPYKVNI